MNTPMSVPSTKLPGGLRLFRISAEREDYLSRIVRAVSSIAEGRPYYDTTVTEIYTRGEDPDRCPGSFYPHQFARIDDRTGTINLDQRLDYVYMCECCGARMIQRWKPMPSLPLVLLGR